MSFLKVCLYGYIGSVLGMTGLLALGGLWERGGPGFFSVLPAAFTLQLTPFGLPYMLGAFIMIWWNVRKLK